MTHKNSLHSWIFLLIPVFLLFLFSGLIAPLKLLFAESANVKYISYAIALAIGIFLYRRSRIVRDHEWYRQSALKSVDKHIKAEERGVWEQDAVVPVGLGAEGQAALGGNIGQLTSERQTAELEQEDKRDVTLLQEANHVVKATRRIGGVETFDENEVQSTIGATRRAGPMDRFLDWLSRKVSGSDRAEERLQERQARLAEKSSSAPMPASPLSGFSMSQQTSRDDNYQDPDQQVNSAVYDPTGKVSTEQNGDISSGQDSMASPSFETQAMNSPVATHTPAPKAVPVDPEMERLYGSDSQSIEAMAAGGSAGNSSATSSAGSRFSDPNIGAQSGYTINRCSGCGHANEANTRFCAMCGTNL